MPNSSLIKYTVLSPNNSGKRTHAIDRITPHCAVGQLKALNLANCFSQIEQQKSCNYCIGTEGDIVLVCDEANRSWCSSSNENDQRAITIECASDKTDPYAFNQVVYNKLLDLCTDICKRYNKSKLIWFGDKEKSLSYNPKSYEMVITIHQWFANKACPGKWLISRMSALCNEVNKRLANDNEIYRVQLGAFRSRDNAEKLVEELNNKGYECFITK